MATSTSAMTSHRHNFVRQLCLLGCLSKPELTSFLAFSSIAEEEKRRIEARWDAAATAFSELANRDDEKPESIIAQPIADEAVREVVASLKQATWFQKTFNNRRIQFEEVEIDNIIACQRFVDLDFADGALSNPPMTGASLGKFCLDLGEDVPNVAVARSDLNKYTFASDHPGLKCLGVQESAFDLGNVVLHPGGLPVRVVQILLGYSASTINVFKVGSRRILQNGFHRLYALRRAGVRRAPVVTLEVTEPEIEMPEVIIEMPRTFLIHARRPALMKDFFNPLLTTEIEQRRSIRFIDIEWMDRPGLIPIVG
jgi:hypothetical protein